MPSSFAEHSIPCDSTPRTLARVITSPAGSRAPTVAQGAFIPATALGAPQTIGKPLGHTDVDDADLQPIGVRVRIDALDVADDDPREGRGGERRFLDFEPGHRQPFAQLGAADRRIGHRAQPVLGKLHADIPGVFISRELPQEAEIVQVELADVGDAVAQHREAVGAHAEGEALIALRIDADRAEHVRVDLP